MQKRRNITAAPPENLCSESCINATRLSLLEELLGCLSTDRNLRLSGSVSLGHLCHPAAKTHVERTRRKHWDKNGAARPALPAGRNDPGAGIRRIWRFRAGFVQEGLCCPVTRSTVSRRATLAGFFWPLLPPEMGGVNKSAWRNRPR